MSTSDCESARPRIMADDSISVANVLRFFSISSSLDSRVRIEWCTLQEQRQNKSGFESECNMLPETSVFGRYEAAAHSDNCKESDLFQIGALAFGQVRYIP